MLSWAKLIEVVFPYLVRTVVEQVDGDGSEVLIPGAVTAGGGGVPGLRDHVGKGAQPLPAATARSSDQWSAGRRQRRTTGLLGMLHPVAVALAGRPGVRLAIVVARTTLLRPVRGLPEQPVSTPPGCWVSMFSLFALGVYASVLLEMSTRRLIDV